MCIDRRPVLFPSALIRCSSCTGSSGNDADNDHQRGVGFRSLRRFSNSSSAVKLRSVHSVKMRRCDGVTVRR